MRFRVGVLVCLVVVGIAVAWAVEPRFHQSFPSTVDDWSAIRDTPEQLRGILRLESPEEGRYRPGFVAWNALQWYTFGGPDRFAAATAWAVPRIALLVAGVALLALLLIEAGRPRIEGRDARWLLVAGVPLAAITAPSLAVDLARNAPQEVLMVACMSLGAVLLVRCFDRLLDPSPPSRTLVAVAVLGLVSWWFGVLQKETSVCVLLLAPFLWPTLARERRRWGVLETRRRVWIGVLAGAIVLPYVPLGIRTTHLWLSGERVYEDAAAAKGYLARLGDQLEGAGNALSSDLPTAIVVAALLLVAVSAVRRGPDWLSVGLLVVAFAFLVSVAETGVVVSRYYLPPIVLAALALARSAASLGSRVVAVTGAALLLGGAWQAWDSRGWVESWAARERERETLVREAAARRAGGCEVDATGLNVEVVLALRVLMPLADDPARGCSPGDRYLVVIDQGAPGTETPPDDPVLSACTTNDEPVWESDAGRIFRCTA